MALHCLQARAFVYQPTLIRTDLLTLLQFIEISRLPLLARMWHRFRRQALAWLGYPIPSRYVCYPGRNDLGTGYILLEFVERTQGKMLSSTWKEKRGDVNLRKNLFHSFARILLALARVPLPRIGSFTIDTDGYVHLDNRPHILEGILLENENIPNDFKSPYSTVDSFVQDILSLHDARLTHQPNGINDGSDGVYQMGALAAARAMFPRLYRRELNNGPFIFTHPDLHQSNFFVDDNWNITKVLDWEFSCSYPIEFQQPPYWLSDRAIDMIDIDEYEELRKEFMAALIEEEESVTAGNTEHLRLSSIMQRGWEIGTFWSTSALESPKGFCTLVYQRVLPFFKIREDAISAERHVLLMRLFNSESSKLLKQKKQDKEQYDQRLEAAFASEKT